MSEVTRILSAIDQGDPRAAEKLLPLVYDELRKLAAQKLAHEKPGQTLQGTETTQPKLAVELRLMYGPSSNRLIGATPSPLSIAATSILTGPMSVKASSRTSRRRARSPGSTTGARLPHGPGAYSVRSITCKPDKDIDKTRIAESI